MNVRKRVLAALCMTTGAFALTGAPALAATEGNAYKSRFNGIHTEAEHFWPQAMAVNADGDVFASNFFGANGIPVVDEFNASGSGKPLIEFHSSETPQKSFAQLTGIAVNANGDVFITDSTGNGVVDEFSAAGKYISQFSGERTAATSFYPAAVAVGSGGDVYVADREHGVVDEFNPTGQGAPIAELTGVETSGKSFVPRALATDSSGNVYVIDEEHNLLDEFDSSGKLVREITGSGVPQGSWVPHTVAVAPSGEVYIANHEAEAVDRFSSTGVYLSQFEGGATPRGFFEPGGIAVNASGEVYVGEEPSEPFSSFVNLYSKAVPVPEVVTGVASEVHPSSATLSGSVNPSGGLEATCEFRYGTEASIRSTAPCVPAGPFSGLSEVSAEIPDLQPNTTYQYRLEGTTSNGITPGEEKTFTTPATIPPTVSIRPVLVTTIGEHSATFEGEVNPNKSETSYRFEDSTDGVSWTALGELSAGNGEVPVTVTQTMSNLTDHTTYHVRLVAVNFVGETNTSAEETFTTLAASPLVFAAAATDIIAGEATLQATIHPENEPTTYRFEYGPSAAYGSTVPAGEGDLPASSTPTQVFQTITRLSPNTTYHFRVIADNGVGAPMSTPDQTFTTLPGGETPAVCPNEQVRAESDVNPETGKPFSTQLPECRAYELVSPPLTNGAPFSSEAVQAITAGSIVRRVGLEGSTVLVNSTGIWPDKEEQPANDDLTTSAAKEGVKYKLSRGESGWGFKSEVPPATDLRAYLPFVVPSGDDLSTNGIWSGAGFAPGESSITVGFEFNPESNLYLLEPDGALAEIGPSVPLSDRGAPVVSVNKSIEPDGVSADLSRVLFGSPYFRWPFDQTEVPSTSHNITSLYEYIGTGHTGVEGDVPTLVGLDNTGTLVSQCGTEPGEVRTPSGFRTDAGGISNEAEGISAGGSTVFFTALGAGAQCEASSQNGEGTGPVVNQLFARIGTPGKGAEVGSAVTVNVAGSTKCATATFDSCNVTKAVKYQGSSTDGSKVFFTSEQPLAGGTDSTNNLYECGLPGDSGAPPAAIAPVNPCPDLLRVSLPASGTGANVQSVIAVSADGSHVYFTAEGVLAGENAEHNTPAPGQDNLYVWQEPSVGYPQGHTAFIATLPSATLGEEAGEGGQTTPDGDAFVFTSRADLTPDDTSTVNQVFLYEAEHEALIRVSEGQDAFNDDGNTTTDPASIAVREGRRTISDDGSKVVFESSDALTTQVHGEPRHNVYLWRGGNVSLISDGTPAGEAIPPAGASQHSAGLVGIDASGQNVFFVTETHLVGQATDELPNLYDARIDGGFPAPKNDECSGEACQGALPAALAPLSPGSLSPGGVGNLVPQAKAKLPLKPRTLTRAQKLAKALEACAKDKSKEKRAKCKSAAHKLYGAKLRAKGKPPARHKTRISSGGGGK